MTDDAPRFAKDQLKSIIERIERLEEEKKAIADDIREVYAEAKGNGYDVKALRTIVKLRKQDADERREQESILETYLHALGMLFDTPLGRAATERATTAAKPSAPRTAAALAQAMADDGLISQEAAAETARISAAVDKLEESAIARAVANPKVREAFKKLGTPVELTEQERAQGYSAALISPDGTRMMIGTNVAERATRARAQGKGKRFGDAVRSSIACGDALTKPSHLPSDKAIKDIADRAEARAARSRAGVTKGRDEHARK